MELTVIGTNHRKTRNAYQDENGDIYLDCTNCGEKKLLNEFCNDRRMKFYQKESQCKVCKNIISCNYQKSNRERAAEISREWRKNNKERAAETRRKWYAINKDTNKAYIVSWEKENPTRRSASWHRRRALKRMLPNTLTGDAMKNMLEGQQGKCYISSSSTNLDLEHFIPLSWGAGGTTYENCYYMSRPLNNSKRNKNPFEWIKKQPQEYQDNFYNILVPELAARNEMSIEEFTEYVYQCEKNAKNAKNAKELVL